MLDSVSKLFGINRGLTELRKPAINVFENVAGSRSENDE